MHATDQKWKLRVACGCRHDKHEFSLAPLYAIVEISPDAEEERSKFAAW